MLPQVVDYGRVKGEEFVKSMSICVIIPLSFDAQKTIVIAKPSMKDMLIQEINKEIIKDADKGVKQIINYRLSWPQLPSGHFEEKITFMIRHEKQENDIEIELPIRGEVVI